MRQSWETMTSVSAGHIILTPTQPVGSGRPQRGSNPGPPHQESRALPTELPRPPIALKIDRKDLWAIKKMYQEQQLRPCTASGSGGRHSGSGSRDLGFESWLCQIDFKSLGKALYMHFLTRSCVKGVTDYRLSRVL